MVKHMEAHTYITELVPYMRGFPWPPITINTVWGVVLDES